MIARRDSTLVFVEVKTRREPRADGVGETPYFRPLARLRHRQRERVRRAAWAWLRARGYERAGVAAPSSAKRSFKRAVPARRPAAGRPWGLPDARASTVRFDAIGVVLDVRGDLKRLEHVEGAW